MDPVILDAVAEGDNDTNQEHDDTGVPDRVTHEFEQAIRLAFWALIPTKRLLAAQDVLGTPVDAAHRAGGQGCGDASLAAKTVEAFSTLPLDKVLEILLAGVHREPGGRVVVDFDGNVDVRAGGAVHRVRLRSIKVKQIISKKKRKQNESTNALRLVLKIICTTIF